MSLFVFFYVGADISVPTKMVASLKAVMPEAEVIMCTDDATPEVPGVSERKISRGDVNQIMYWRTRAFAEARIMRPAMYIDTDMLFLLPLDPATILDDREIMFCRRTFQRDMGFNGEQRGGAFKELNNIPLGTLYPYLGCATITKNYHAWKALSILMGFMGSNLRSWYGDQEALKIYAHMLYPELVGEIHEVDYACPPDEMSEDFVPYIVHYKGDANKEAFLNA